MYVLAREGKRPAHCHISQQLNLGSKAGDSFSLNLEKENQVRDLRGRGVGLSEKKKPKTQPIEK